MSTDKNNNLSENSKNLGAINENVGKIDKKKLLEELSIDIANQFGLDKENAKQLISNNTLDGIDSLKSELDKLHNNNDTLDRKKIEKLFFTLKGASETIENISKLEIKVLKENIENTTNIDDFNKNSIDNYLPKKLINIAKNPSKPHEHILGFALGTTNSMYSSVETLFNIGKGIISTPYHLYMIVSGKGITDSFKNV